MNVSNALASLASKKLVVLLFVLSALLVLSSIRFVLEYFGVYNQDWDILGLLPILLVACFYGSASHWGARNLPSEDKTQGESL